MAEADDDLDDDIEVEEGEYAEVGGRDEEFADDDKVRKQCLDIFKSVEQGYQDQWERANSQIDYWEMYNCVLNANQFYSGNSKIYVPLVHDAVEARKTRFVNQVFPVSGRHIEVFAAQEDRPEETMALLEFYIRKAKLRTKVIPALVRNGDIEGHYNVYVSWVKNKRHAAMRVKRKPQVDGIDAEGEEIDDVLEQKVIQEYPRVEVISDMDVCILPQTCDSADDALESGGSLTILRRWSKYRIRKLIRDGEISQEAGRQLLKEMGARSKEHTQPDKSKTLATAAGVKIGKGGTKTALIYETWAMVKIPIYGEDDEDDKKKKRKDEYRLCKMFYGGNDRVLSCKRNPNWDDRPNLISAPIDQLEGIFRGISKVKPVETFQYAANDFLNEAMDSATYSLMPIVMTDPARNPRVSSMVLNVAAIWETNPKDTTFANFPPLYKEGVLIVQAFKEQIFQTLGVNPSMIPQAATSKKANQAQIANEQQVDILTTADAVTNLEGAILTPMLQKFFALDHQHRDHAITVRAFGRMGIQANMQQIEPVQMGRRFELRWFGVEAARNAQQMQIQMAGMNVLRGLGPQDTPGYQKNLAPIVQQFVENLWGPRLAPEIFKDIRKEIQLEPVFENEMLKAGYILTPLPMDDDATHIKVHMQAAQETGDPAGNIAAHMKLHQQQMQQKQMAQMQQAMMQAMQQKGQMGMPGGAAPGTQGQPAPGRQGAVPGGPRPQGPPGMIHQDRMPMGMPRAVRG